MLSSRVDNYVENNRFHGNPNLTDETDIFDELHRQDRRLGQERRAQQSIQRWNGRI